MKDFDYRESPISFCYETRNVEFYFTRKSNYECCIKRNPNYIIPQDLQPGYRIVYPFNQVRTPEYLLRVPKPKKEAENCTLLTLEAA